MAGDKGIRIALIGLRKAGNAPELPQRAEILHASVENFMGIALVTHIKKNPVF